MGLPGVRVGPLDPEATADFGHVGKGNRARELIRRHALAHPVALQQAHGRKLHEERTKGLDLDEVRANVELPDGVPDGSEIVGAAVRGEETDPRGLVVTYVFRTPKGRTGKWHADYDEDVLPASAAEGDRRVAVKDAKEAGLPFDVETSGPRDYATGGARGQALERENQRLKQRLDELARELTELRQSTLGEDEGGAAEEPVVPSEEPFDGYDEMDADKLRSVLRHSDQETRDRVLEYELRHKNRRTVVQAAQRPAAE